MSSIMAACFATFGVGLLVGIVGRFIKIRKSINSLERQKLILREMESRRVELERYNEELSEYLSLAMRGGDVGYCYYLKGLTKLEQAEALQIELKGMIEEYEREYGVLDVV